MVILDFNFDLKILHSNNILFILNRNSLSVSAQFLLNDSNKREYAINIIKEIDYLSNISYRIADKPDGRMDAFQVARLFYDKN